ncbi:sugar uptake porin [Salmonella bongori]|nr:sugar uptake porin [Salmonella bongori]
MVKEDGGGPGVSPASSLNGDAHVGRLGNEKDNYLELSLGKKMTFDRWGVGTF